MALAFRSAGTWGNGVSTVTPGLPSGWAKDDLFLMFVEYSAVDAATVVATLVINGWTLIDNINTTNTGATPTGLAAFWRRASAQEVAPVVPDVGNHTSAQIFAFTGAMPFGYPHDVEASSQTATSSTSATLPAITTTVDNTLNVFAISTGVSSASAQFSGWTVGTEQADNCAVSGDGGGFAVATNAQTTAGAATVPTVTLATASEKAMISIALKPRIALTGLTRDLTAQGGTGGVFNVVSYGAIRDGSADSTAAFNAAFVAASAYGSSNGAAEVKIPPGDYLIQGRVTMKPNIVISAYGAYIFGGTDYTGTGNLMFATIVTGSGYTGGGADNVTVLGGIWDAKGQNAATSGAGTGDANHRDIFCINNARNWRFKDCTFRNVPSWHSIDANSIDGLVINACRFEGFVDKSELGTRADSEAIQLDTGADGTPCKNVTVQDCTVIASIEGNGLGAPGKLIGSHTPTVGNTGFHQNIRIANNYTNGTPGAAIQGYDWSNATVNENVLLNCGGEAIKFYGNVSGVANQICITDNVIELPTTRAIYFTDTGNTGVGFSNCLIQGNTIISAGSQAAIDVAHYDTSVIDGNQITNTGTTTSSHGIFGDVCTDTSVTNNNITGPTTNLATGGAGIQWQAAVRAKVTGNKIYSVAEHGIWTSGGGTDVVVSDNYIQGANRSNGTFYGIYVGGTAVTNPAIFSNVVRAFGSGSEATAAIRTVSGCTGTVLYANDCGTLALQDTATSRGTWDPFLNPPQTLSLGTAFTNATTTANAVFTSAPVPAGTYVIEVYGFSKSSVATTPTINISLDTTGTVSNFRGQAEWFTSATAKNSSAFNSTITTAVAMAPDSSTNTDRSFAYRARVALSVGGTISFKMAMSAATATGTIDVASFMRITPTA